MEVTENLHERSLLRRKLRLLTLIGVCLSVLLLSGVATLFVIDIEDIIYAKGKITSELRFDIQSHVSGRVKKLCADEGDDVKENQVIAEIDTLDYELQYDAIVSEIREAEAELAVRKAELDALKCTPLPKELWYARTNFIECRDKAERMAARLVRYEKLRASKAISQKDFEDTEIENIQAQAEFARAKMNLEIVKSGLGDRNIEKQQRSIDLVLSKIAGRRSALEQLKRRIADCRLVAPAEGRIVTLPCKYTRFVTKGECAVKMSAGGVVKGVAYVDERMIRKVKAGQIVRVSSDVFNKLEYGHFEGKVSRVHDAPVEVPGNAQLTQYPVEVMIDAQGRPMKIGSSASFSIITGREPVIFTILGLTHDESSPRSFFKKPQKD